MTTAMSTINPIGLNFKLCAMHSVRLVKGCARILNVLSHMCTLCGVVTARRRRCCEDSSTPSPRILRASRLPVQERMQAYMNKKHENGGRRRELQVSARCID